MFRKKINAEFIQKCHDLYRNFLFLMKKKPTNIE